MNQSHESPFQENQPQESPLSWEAQLQQRANELLARRIGPLRAEVEHLQSSLAEISSRLLEQAQPEATEEESSGLLDHVKQWFADSSTKAEEDFQSRLAEARNETAAQAREDVEREFSSRLENARIEWQTATRQANEEEFQKRLETACAEAGALARRESEAQLEELREQLKASRDALTLAVSSAKNSNFDMLRSAVEEVDAQRSQSDTLTALVRRAAQFAPRVVFFVLKGGDAVGWKANGFENGLNDETVKLLTVHSHTPSLLGDALSTFGTAVGTSSSPGENSAVLGLYGSPAPERAVAIPLVVRGKAAAVLYADSGTQSQDAINTAAIETLMKVTSMGIELLPARRGVEPPRPSVSSAQSNLAPAIVPGAAPSFAPATEPASATAGATAAVVMAAPAVAEVESKPATTGELIPPQPVVETVEEQPEQAPERLEAAEAQSEAPARIEAEPVAPTPIMEADTEELPVVEIAKPAGHFAVEPPLPAPATPMYEEHMGFSPSAPVAPAVAEFAPPEFRREERFAEEAPAPVFSPAFNQAPAFTPAPEPARAPQSVPTPASETEQRAHNDARRFARLLVSEIKLYNAAKVNDGRRNFDLYDRLKDEVDRSRKVYDKRVSPAVAARFDYFYDELVQTLAEGDPAKLGNNCPGPVVLAS
jgi:hypothetical protein